MHFNTHKKPLRVSVVREGLEFLLHQVLGFGMIWDSRVPTFQRLLQPKKQHFNLNLSTIVNPSNLQNSYTKFLRSFRSFWKNHHFSSGSEKSAYLPLFGYGCFFFTCTEPSSWISPEAQDGHARSGGGISHQRRLWSGPKGWKGRFSDSFHFFLVENNGCIKQTWAFLKKTRWSSMYLFFATCVFFFTRNSKHAKKKQTNN